MAQPGITPVVMPKWGLEMREGTIAGWLVDEGARIEVGTPLLDVETDKISNAVEAPDPGLLRRKIAREGETLPVKALLAVLAEPAVSDAEIDAYIAAYQVPAAAEGEDDSGPAFQWTEVDGIRVRHARRGPEDGTPVLFLHGFGGDLGNWLFNLDAVAEVAPVIALDLPGHGQSDPRLPGAGTLADLAGFVEHFLAAIGVERAHLVGHSMGGAIAAQLARQAPARVASLTLVSSAGLGPEINSDYLQGFVQAESRRDLKPVAEQLFADPSLVTRALLDDLLKYKRLDGVTGLLQQLLTALFEGGRQRDQPGLALSGLPLLVLWGEDDRIIPAAHARLAAPGARVQVLSGAGHMPMLERASEVNVAIRQHLA